VQTKAERRVAKWTMELQRWALKLGRLHPRGSAEADYALGVVYAIAVARRKVLPMLDADLAGQSKDTQSGYYNSLALLNHALELGEAPTGDFGDLLGAQFPE